MPKEEEELRRRNIWTLYPEAARARSWGAVEARLRLLEEFAEQALKRIEELERKV